MDISKNDYIVEFPDVSRKNFLYSAFPTNRDVNPKHWDSKLSFWTKEIHHSSSQLKDVFVDINKLKQRFQDGSVFPLGLKVVVEQMVKDGSLVSSEPYSKVFQDDWLNWAWNVSITSASWMWKKIAGQDDGNKEYVIVDQLKEMAEQLIEEHNRRNQCSRTDLVVPFKVLCNYRLQGVSINEKTAIVIVGYLRQQRKVQVFVDENGQKIVKFPAKGKVKAEVVNDDDLKILRLKQTIAKLQLDQRQQLTTAAELRNRAKEMVSSDKEQAKRLLRESKNVAKFVKKREDELFLLNEQLNKIKDIDNQKMVIGALDSSATLLSSILKEEDLSPSNVESTLSKTDETLEHFKEFDNAIHEGLQQLERTEGIDIDELEEELMNLVLPDVPSTHSLDSAPKESKDMPRAKEERKDLQQKVESSKKGTQKLLVEG